MGTPYIRQIVNLSVAHPSTFLHDRHIGLEPVIVA
jgi:hypothetical protein